MRGWEKCLSQSNLRYFSQPWRYTPQKGIHLCTLLLLLHAQLPLHCKQKLLMLQPKQEFSSAFCFIECMSKDSHSLLDSTDWEHTFLVPLYGGSLKYIGKGINFLCVHYKNFTVILTNKNGYLSCTFVFSTLGTEQRYKECVRCVGCPPRSIIIMRDWAVE